MASGNQELIYTVPVDELRSRDFVARALAFPQLLAQGDTAEEAIERITSLLTYQVRDARQHGEQVPADVMGAGDTAQQLVAVRVAA